MFLPCSGHYPVVSQDATDKQDREQPDPDYRERPPPARRGRLSGRMHQMDWERRLVEFPERLNPEILEYVGLVRTRFFRGFRLRAMIPGSLAKTDYRNRQQSRNLKCCP